MNENKTVFGIDVCTSANISPDEAFLISKYNQETNEFYAVRIKGIGKYNWIRKWWFLLKIYIKYKIFKHKRSQGETKK